MQTIRKIGQSLPPRLRWYVLATIAIGVPVVAAAVAACVQAHPSPRALIGVATFFSLTMLAEWRPVPIDIEGKRLVSLAFVFIVSSQILFGWEWSILIGGLGIGLAMALDHAEPIKTLFNAATYVIATALAALPMLLGASRYEGYGLVALTVVIGGAIFVFVNVLLVCAAIGFATGGSIHEIFRDHLRHSGPIFAIAVFVAAQAVILWDLSAPLVLLLSAPLFALTLYQRSSVRGRAAEEAASTDSLTGLKNRRAFEKDAAQMLEGVEVAGVSLCLLDIDRFKQVNDRFGHHIGDAILQRLAEALEEAAPGSGYRLGGDEFVVLLDAREPTEVISSVQSCFATRQDELAGLTEAVTISAGIAFFPEHADDLHSLQKRADMALYRSKFNGRAQVSIYGAEEPGPDPGAHFAGVVRPALGALNQLPADGRLLTVHRLVSLVDAVADAAARECGLLSPAKFSAVLDRWRVFNSNHSRSVATLAVALARRLGVDGDELENVNIAALLHDVGKIALPESVLSKPGPLMDDERELVQRHSIIGYELLCDLGIPQAAEFVLHHHERWDGGGYPSGKAGAEIPFGSRLILVADAFDALTSDRAYRRGVSVEAAIHEIQRESGRQFDPLIVSALHEHFAHPEASPQPAPGAHHGSEVLEWSSSTSS